MGKILIGALLCISLNSCILYPEDRYIKKMVVAVLEKVKEDLRDPYSVRFSMIKHSPRPTVRGSMFVVCGRYNAKNGYGAYGGAEPFCGMATVNTSGKIHVALVGELEPLKKLCTIEYDIEDD